MVLLIVISHLILGKQKHTVGLLEHSSTTASHHVRFRETKLSGDGDPTDILRCIEPHLFRKEHEGDTCIHNGSHDDHAAMYQAFTSNMSMLHHAI